MVVLKLDMSWVRLKSFNKPGHTVYTISQINTYPLGTYAVQVLTSTFSSSQRTAYPEAIVVRLSARLRVVERYCGLALAAYDLRYRTYSPRRAHMPHSMMYSMHFAWQVWSMITYIVLAATPVYTHITR